MRPLGKNYRIDPHSRRLSIETLEDRRMLATFTVTNLLDGPVTAAGDLPGSLRQAIFDANDLAGPDDIDFSSVSGTLLMTEGEFQITDAVTINGPGQELLTIDAQQQSRIFNITAATGDYTFEDVTLTGGKVFGDNGPSDSDFSGGAIRSLTTGNLSLTSTIVNHSSTNGTYARGGGVFASGQVIFQNTTISGNRTLGRASLGGGVFSHESIDINQSTINDNSTAGSRSEGGGIYTFDNVSISDSVITGNSTAQFGSYGGGISAAFVVTIDDSTISRNMTSGSASAGGGIFARVVLLTDSTLSDNVTYGDGSPGGGINALSITLTRSTVSGNSTRGVGASGGGIRATGTFAAGKIDVLNSTVSGNSTIGVNSHGGGISAQKNVTVLESTITDNHTLDASSSGGGIWHYDYSATLSNTILTGNSSGGSNPNYRPGTGTLTANYSLLGTGVIPDSGSDNVFTDNPQLGPLQDNGGPTLPNGAAIQTHALLPGSPAIDMGDPGFTAPPDFDQRGDPFTRVHNSRIDIGAYEAQPLLADVDGDQMVTGLDFLQIQIGGGDIARWEAEYGVSEPIALPLAAALTIEEPSAAAYWLALPEGVEPDREESTPRQQFTTVPIDRAFADAESVAGNSASSLALPTDATSPEDAPEALTDEELDEALDAEFD